MFQVYTFVNQGQRKLQLKKRGLFEVTIFFLKKKNVIENSSKITISFELFLDVLDSLMPYLEIIQGVKT